MDGVLVVLVLVVLVVTVVNALGSSEPHQDRDGSITRPMWFDDDDR